MTNIDTEKSQHSLLLVVFMLLVFLFTTGTADQRGLPRIPFTVP